MIWAKTTETLSKRKEEETPKHYGQEYIFILKLTIIIWFFRKRKKKNIITCKVQNIYVDRNIDV